MQNNDEKWPNFCNIWNLLANLEKSFSGKYVEVYILVLILWKTNKGSHSNHIRQKKMNPLPPFTPHPPQKKMMKKKDIFLKVYRSIAIWPERQFYQLFITFYFTNSYCIITENKYNFWHFFGQFLPHLIQIFNLM